MKINSPRTPVPSPVSGPPKAANAQDAARQKLTALAASAVAKSIVAASAAPQPPTEHPLLKDFGHALGVGLGVLVTEGLRLVPSWNKPVLGADGKPVQDVPGATRLGQHDILKRHEEVVGPQIAALVAKLQPGVVHDLLQGLADGATEAPGDAYRLDAKLSDGFDG